jgi:hypothetical protein
MKFTVLPVVLYECGAHCLALVKENRLKVNKYSLSKLKVSKYRMLRIIFGLTRRE